MEVGMREPIAVLISSYERLEGLWTLLAALDRQRLGLIEDAAVELVVVDNSGRRSAEALCKAFAERSRFRLTYVDEPRRGLSFARNASLRAASSLGAVYGAFIDDDEVPAPDWLASLHLALASGHAAAAVGPVYPVFGRVPPPWSVDGAFFSKKLTPVGPSLEDGYTSNALVRLDVLRKHGLTFDLRCNLTGGEDTLLFSELRRRGETIVWAETARVDELIPAHRIQRAWVIRRWFRTGGTIVDCAGARDERSIGRLAFEGTARIAFGAVHLAYSLIRHPFRSERHVAALFTLSRGAGVVAATLGRRHLEYGSLIRPDGSNKRATS